MGDDRRAQAAGLLEIAGVAEAFNPPVASNFVHLLIPRPRDASAAVRAIAEATEPLNRADQALLDGCAQLLAEHPDVYGERAIEHWREGIRRRVNLQGIRWATEVAARLAARSGGTPSLEDRLRRDHPGVLAAFRTVPRSLLELVRINGYLWPERIAPVLASLTADLCDPELHAAIERLEVARLRPEVEPSTIDFPTLIVVVRTEALSDEQLASAIDRIARRLAAAGPGPTPRAQYAQPLTPNATLTQGFYLYKRYLRLVGLLDELYDPASGHALTRPTLGGVRMIVERGPLTPRASPSS